MSKEIFKTSLWSVFTAFFLSGSLGVYFFSQEIKFNIDLTLSIILFVLWTSQFIYSVCKGEALTTRGWVKHKEDSIIFFIWQTFLAFMAFVLF